MNINTYSVIGVVLLFLSGAFLLMLVIYNLNVLAKQRRIPLYQRKLAKMRFPDTFCIEIREAYQKAENMREMFSVLKVKYPKGVMYKRILAAEDYLLHSRYQDFETTLFKYLSDGSLELEKMHTEIIRQEVMKRRRLPCTDVTY
jgi:hypothetical protein